GVEGRWGAANSLNSFTRGASASARARDSASLTTSNSSGQKTRIMVAQLPAGTTTTSASAFDREARVARATLAAASACPAFHAGWPQQVVPSGTVTTWSRRRSTRTAATPAAGETASTTQVGKMAIRTDTTVAQFVAWPGRRAGAAAWRFRAMPRRARVLCVLLAPVLLAALAVGTARAADNGGDELSPKDDNGAAGRNGFPGNAGHVEPVKACSEQVHDTDASLVIRVLPKGPLQPDGKTLAFTAGVCIYLPPNYGHSHLRYPVLYLLHGGGGDAAVWVTFGHIRSIMDGKYQADPSQAAIVVMPDGTDAQWYDAIDGTIQNEKYMFDYLIPYVDRHFRTIAERDGRVIDGLSNGGYGAMEMAAKRPDLFVAAGGMSSNIAGRSFSGL